MMEIERPKIDTSSLSADGRYGKFVLEPLERGFGMTLGNSLRRVLLSSLPGVAVTSIKIDGVVHEFSTIEGVKEDVTEIVLNVKGITAKLYSDTPKTVRIEATGEGEVTAGSIQQDAEIEVQAECQLRPVGTSEIAPVVVVDLAVAVDVHELDVAHVRA